MSLLLPAKRSSLHYNIQRPYEGTDIFSGPEDFADYLRDITTRHNQYAPSMITLRDPNNSNKYLWRNVGGCLYHIVKTTGVSLRNALAGMGVWMDGDRYKPEYAWLWYVYDLASEESRVKTVRVFREIAHNPENDAKDRMEACKCILWYEQGIPKSMPTQITLESDGLRQITEQSEQTIIDVLPND